MYDEDSGFKQLSHTAERTRPMDFLENKTFDEVAVGESATLTRQLTQADIDLFAAMSGDAGLAKFDGDGLVAPIRDLVAQGMWGGALFSALLSTKLPGPGTVYQSQTFTFDGPVNVGDTVTVTVRVKEKNADTQAVCMECLCLNQDKAQVISGEAWVTAPVSKIKFTAADVPEAFVYERGNRLKALIDAAKAHDPLRTAVTHPVEPVSLKGAIAAAEAGLIIPLLIGPEAKIQSAAEEAGLDISPYMLIDTPHSHAAAAKSVELARQNEVEAIMKGALHTDEIMGEVVEKKNELRTERRISHVFIMDAPAYPKILFITDAAINIAPDLEAKRDITQNAIDVARALGVERPKVACLSAVETVYPPLQSTIDAAALCKMADRGQITGGVLDGPLAFDNAISQDAAATKALVSDVAGEADILLAPNLEAGNMIAKQLDYLGGATAAGIVMGARIPIILTSRAEKTLPRMASCAVAQLIVRSKMS